MAIEAFTLRAAGQRPGRRHELRECRPRSVCRLRPAAARQARGGSARTPNATHQPTPPGWLRIRLRPGRGGELRHIDPDKSAFALVDDDVHFQELNAAMFSGSWTLPDKSTISAGIDYRKSPYLTAWNALQGQPFLTLYDMLKLHSKEEIVYIAGVRVADLAASNLYVLDLSARYPPTNELRINPRLRLGYSEIPAICARSRSCLPFSSTTTGQEI